MIVNTDIAKNPLNWAIVALMVTLFMFVLAQLVILFNTGQAAVTSKVTSSTP